MHLVVQGVDLSRFLGVPYVGKRHPKTVSVEEFLAKPKLGSNCQLFTLGVLSYAGFYIEHASQDGGRMGSRELWLHNSFTHYVVAEDAGHLRERLRPFDILFFFPGNADPKELERMHLGIYVGVVDGLGSAHCVLHNHDVGDFSKSEVWDLEQFELCEKQYRLQGAKRPTLKIKK